jgi:hypothetical protein
LTVDIQVVLCQHLGSLVNRATGTIEDTTQHVLRDTELQAVVGELDFGLDQQRKVSKAPKLKSVPVILQLVIVPS